MSVSSRIVGVDFDNTLADYDAIMHAEALRAGLIPAETEKSKKSVRDAVRRTPEGEVRWQKLQARVYGPLMPQALPMPGAEEFLSRCRESGTPVRIVSHKSARYEYDDTGTDYREAALGWMEARGFFSASGAGLSRGDVYFEDTREAKVRRVGALGCTHFIDDLEETFLEPAFPSGTERILFDRHKEAEGASKARRAASWGEITESLFHAVN